MFDGIKNILFLDFETFYGPGYTLRGLTIPEYLLDARYETILCAVAMNGAPSGIVDGPEFGEFISKIDPQTTATVTFNALFDNAILAWHYGWVPKLMLDSMNMARALRGHVLPKLNLQAVCDHFGLPHDKSAIVKVSGKRRADIMADPSLWTEFCAYANRDNERSRDIFKLLIKDFPHSERRIMDLVIRCAVEPRFMLDKQHLVNHLHAVRRQKIKLLEACGAKFAPWVDPVLPSPTEVQKQVASIGLMSQVGFTKALEAFGVEVKYKSSPTGNGLIPAFAKTDTFMAELQEHFDTRVQALACARLGIKSTLEETRTEKLISIASLAWDHYRDGNPRLYAGGGTMPVPLRYAGAHTHRLSGDWRLNMQNMPRGGPGKPPQLRKALVAPPGHVVIAGDLSQIEARLVAWLAGATSLLAEFAKPGGDPYSAFASLIFGFPVDRRYKDPTGKKPHEVHGFIGKTGVLGLGYQCSDVKFFNMVATLARIMGIKLEDVVPWTMALAERTVHTYRGRYHQIPALWDRLQAATETVWLHPSTEYMNVGPVTIRYGEIEGPNGLTLLYHDPHEERQGQQGGTNSSMNRGMRGGRCFVYTYGWGQYLMYGGKMLENIIQFLARIIIMNAALRLSDLGYRFVLQAHDELAYIVPKSDEANAKAIIYRELTRRPSWGRDIPLEAEVKSGPTYGDCK